MSGTKIVYIEGNDNDVVAAYERYEQEEKTENESVCCIRAGFGYRCCEGWFALAHEHTRYNKVVIVTNAVHLLQLISLDGKNKDKDELWFIRDGKFVNVYDIYPNIRPVNNLMKMYMGNLFEE